MRFLRLARSALQSRASRVSLEPIKPPTSNQPNNDPAQQQTSPDKRGTDEVPLVIKERARQRSHEEVEEAQHKAELDSKLVEYLRHNTGHTDRQPSVWSAIISVSALLPIHLATALVAHNRNAIGGRFKPTALALIGGVHIPYVDVLF